MFLRLGADARRMLGSAAVDGFFNGFSRIARLHPLARPARHAVEHVKDIRYFDSTMHAHLLDVYRPLPAQATGQGVKRSGPPWPILCEDGRAVAHGA